MLYLGIDFGTSNSCIAFFDSERGLLEVIDPDVEAEKLPGGRVFPSAVGFDRKGNILYTGWEAYYYGRAYPNRVVDKVKRWVGKTYSDISLDLALRNIGYPLIKGDDEGAIVKFGERTYTAEEIVTHFIRFLVNEARSYMKSKVGMDIELENLKIIATVPAYYDQNQVDSIREAIETGIGITQVKLISEPIASACAALHNGKLDKDDKYVMVIDEGAGTLDIMLVDTQQTGLDEDEIRLRGVTIAGHTMLGGADMDDRIVEWVLDKLRDDETINRDELKNINTRELKIEAEDAKIDISEGRSSEAQMRIKGFAKFVPMNEKDLYDIVSPVMQKCKKEILEVLDNLESKYEIKKGDISKVILVGGPLRMPVFKNAIEEIFPNKIVEGINPMECVAIGAAVSPVVKYRVPADRDYGLLKDKGERKEFIPAIKKDMPLPCGVIIDWETEALETEISVEVIQKLKEDQVGNLIEITGSRMGKYNCTTAPVRMTYYIMLGMDEERRVEVVITDSKQRAEGYKEAITNGKEIVRNARDIIFEFRRTIGTIRLHHDDSGDIDLIQKAFYENNLLIAGEFRIVVEICDKFERLKIFEDESSEAKDINSLYIQVDGHLKSIYSHIKSRLSEIRIEDEGTITDGIILQLKSIGDDVRVNEEYVELRRKSMILEDKIRGYKPRIHSREIKTLINNISDIQTDADEKMKQSQKNEKLTKKTEKDVEAILERLDWYQRSLEKSLDNDIYFDSLDYVHYSDAKDGVEMLKNILDARDDFQD